MTAAGPFLMVRGRGAAVLIDDRQKWVSEAQTPVLMGGENGGGAGI